MSRTEKYTTIPSHLKHKPIYVMEGYSPIDGCYKNDTDVIGFSVGNAQWAENGDFVPSIKVWRDVKVTVDGKEHYRISRQSEETTLTRALDLAMLTVKVLDDCLNGQSVKSVTSLHGEVPISCVGSDEERKELIKWAEKQESDIRAHLDKLVKALQEFENHSK